MLFNVGLFTDFATECRDWFNDNGRLDNRQSKDDWKTLWERSKSEECLLQPPDEVFEEAELDSYEVYATADFQDDVRRFEEKDCVAERALLEDGTDTGGRLRWNDAGECVCYVNTEIHKE